MLPENVLNALQDVNEIIIYDTDGTDYSNIHLRKPSEKNFAAVEHSFSMKVDNVMFCHAKPPLTEFYDPLSIKNVAHYHVLGNQELFFKMLTLW